MGFAKPKVSAPASDSTPPVVSESTENETAADYAQRAARRKGVLSSILSQNRRNNPEGGNSTLG